MPGMFWGDSGGERLCGCGVCVSSIRLCKEASDSVHVVTVFTPLMCELRVGFSGQLRAVSGM